MNKERLLKLTRAELEAMPTDELLVCACALDTLEMELFAANKVANDLVRTAWEILSGRDLHDTERRDFSSSI